ncbi:unnamed protein product [Acidithrix sp. C25]|nr:unnamed protein product [Acidithrix sp. C25]
MNDAVGFSILWEPFAIVFLICGLEGLIFDFSLKVLIL